MLAWPTTINALPGCSAAPHSRACSAKTSGLRFSETGDARRDLLKQNRLANDRPPRLQYSHAFEKAVIFCRAAYFAWILLKQRVPPRQG